MIGYRVWCVFYHTERRSFILYSYVYRHYPWDRDMKAVCDEGRLEEHLRKMTHTCGLYSFKLLDTLLKEHRDELILAPVFPLAVGGVFNYGIVMECSEGYRSSHSLIDTIFLPEYHCFECRGKGEFIQAFRLPRETPEWGLMPFCLSHLPKPLKTPNWKTFPIEAVRIDLERYYRVPVRPLGELLGGF